jgi:hypothetical protein
MINPLNDYEQQNSPGWEVNTENFNLLLERLTQTINEVNRIEADLLSVTSRCTAAETDLFNLESKVDHERIEREEERAALLAHKVSDFLVEDDSPQFEDKK